MNVTLGVTMETFDATTESSGVTVYVPPVVKTVTMVFYCLVSMIGVCGNILTITSIVLNRKLRSIPNVYIANLAVADLLVCSVIAPFSAYVSFSGHTAVPDILCTLIGALNAGVLGVTIFSLTAIGVNRFILIVKGTSTYTRIYTRRNVIGSLVAVWLVGGLMVAPALIGFGGFGYNYMMGTCIFKSHDTLTYIYVQTMLHGICVGPCVIITILCYAFIIVHFRKTRNRLKSSPTRSFNSDGKKSSPLSCKSVKEGGVGYRPPEDSARLEEYEFSSSGPSNNNSGGVGSVNHARMLRRARSSRRVVANLCTVFTVFLFCWMPIVTLYTVDFHNKVPATVSHIFYAIAVTNSCLNVFIYAGMNSAFRKSYKNLLTFNCSKVKSSF